MKYTILSIFLLTAYVSARADIKFIKNNFKKATKEAKGAGKMIFVYVYTDWCGPCKLMDKRVFTHGEVSKFYNESFVNLKIDAEKGEGTEFAKNYNIAVYPTYLFLNENGDVLYISRGGKSKEDFLKLGLRGLNPDYYPDNMMRVFENGKQDKEFLDQCLEVFKDNLDVDKIGIVLETYLEQGYFENENEMLQIAEKYLYVLDNKLFEQLNNLGRKEPDKQHYLTITVNRVVNNYIMYNNDLQQNKLKEILSVTLLDKQSQEKLAKKAAVMKKIKFGPQ